MVIDYLSENKIYPVEDFSDGVHLNKNITEIKSLMDPEKVIGYQSIRTYIEERPGTIEEINENFDLVWDAYIVHNYKGNILKNSLDEVKEYWQNKNLENFNLFLKEHPLLYTDGNWYGVEEVDRNEMSQQFLSYQVKVQAGLTPSGIQWHNKKKACKEFTLEEFLTLTLAIEQYTIPYYNLMQSRKEAIFNCTEKIDVFKVPTNYEISE